MPDIACSVFNYDFVLLHDQGSNTVQLWDRVEKNIIYLNLTNLKNLNINWFDFVNQYCKIGYNFVNEKFSKQFENLCTSKLNLLESPKYGRFYFLEGLQFFSDIRSSLATIPAQFLPHDIRMGHSEGLSGFYYVVLEWNFISDLTNEVEATVRVRIEFEPNCKNQTEKQSICIYKHFQNKSESQRVALQPDVLLLYNLSFYQNYPPIYTGERIFTVSNEYKKNFSVSQLWEDIFRVLYEVNFELYKQNANITPDFIDYRAKEKNYFFNEYEVL